MGFLGIGGGKRKKSALGQAEEIKKLRGEMGAYRPKFEEFRGGLRGFRGDVGGLRGVVRPDTELLRSTYRGLLEDPSKRGISQSAIDAMIAREQDIETGARMGYLSQASKDVAARGMSDTGAIFRMGERYDTGAAKRQREAARDIEIENQRLKRSDLFSAGAALGDVISTEDARERYLLGLESDLYGEEARSFGLDLDAFGSQLQSFGPESEAHREAYKPGFWGKLGSSFASALGQGAAGFVTGGVSGIGSNIGQWAAKKLGRSKGTDLNV